jgi:hypothetical protein
MTSSLAHAPPPELSSLLSWDPVPRAQLLPSLHRLLTSLTSDEKSQDEPVVAQFIESAQVAVSNTLRKFLRDDPTEETTKQPVPLCLTEVRGRIIVAQALAYWAKHSAHPWWRVVTARGHDDDATAVTSMHDASLVLSRYRATAILLSTWTLAQVSNPSIYSFASVVDFTFTHPMFVIVALGGCTRKPRLHGGEGGAV